jgi:tryptophan synthase alpha chain
VSRLAGIFAALRGEGRAGLIPFITAGYPDLRVTADLLPALDRAGACVIEVGFPFSDPIADGPVIAAASHQALGRGATVGAIFDLVAAARPRVEAALVAMVSQSLVHRAGPRAFVERAARSGFDGIIVPDIDLADAARLRPLADAQGLDLVLLVAPTTGARRLERIASLCRGFVYLLARAGVTGESDRAPQVERRLDEVRRVTSLPVAVGFGIATPQHVTAATARADAAIVGSALVRAMGDAPEPVAATVDLLRRLAGGLRGAA